MWYSVVDPTTSHTVLATSRCYRDAYDFLLKEEGRTLSSLFIVSTPTAFEIGCQIDLDELEFILKEE